MNAIRPSLKATMAAALLAMAARGAACGRFPTNLSDDRDAYLTLAQGLQAGRGFSVPGSTRPTAYRPPLYPWLLAPISADGQIVGRAMLHAALGGFAAACSVWLAAIAGLTPGRQFLAGAIVAIDPLLVYYATLPMTETLAAALSAGLLAASAGACRSSSPGVQRILSVLAGAMFGLAVLCRPTYWAFAVSVMLFGGWQASRGRLPAAFHEMRSRRADWIMASVVSLAVVAVWPVRNLIVMARPIATTTHGGYTLLLGNNDSYYREVTEQPWGTIWDGSHGDGQSGWVQQINREMEAANVNGELARDRWMTRRACETIAREPVLFAKACLGRFLAFWNVSPRGDARSGVSSRWTNGVALYYVALWAALIAGFGASMKRRGCASELSTILIAAFVAVHLVYWTDARMRAPVMPAIALFAAAAGFDFRRAARQDRAPADESLGIAH